MTHQYIPAIEQGKKVEDSGVLDQIETALNGLKQDLAIIANQMNDFKHMTVVSEAMQAHQEQLVFI